MIKGGNVFNAAFPDFLKIEQSAVIEQLQSLGH